MSTSGSKAKRRSMLAPKPTETEEEIAAALAAKVTADRLKRDLRNAARDRQNVALQETATVREQQQLQAVKDNAANQEAAEKLEKKLLLFYGGRAALHKTVQKVHRLLDEALIEYEGEELASRLNYLNDCVIKTSENIFKKDAEIEMLIRPAQIEEHVEDCLAFQEEVFKIKELIKHNQVSYYNEHPGSTIRPAGIILHNAVDKDRGLGKMPLIEVPTFGGDYREYQMFMDTFNAIIGNQKCDDTLKLSHLKKCLRGDAKTSVFRVGMSSAGSYARALGILEERYGNHRLIARSHLTTIITHAAVKPNDGPCLRSYLTSLSDACDGLEMLGVDITTWDCILVYHVLQKLDLETQRDFNMKHPGRHLPDLDVLVVYLQDRAIAMEDTSNEMPSLSNRQVKAQDKKEKVAANTNLLEATDVTIPTPSPATGTAGKWQAKKPWNKQSADNKGKKESQPCLKCKQPHVLYKCPQFDAMTKQQRNDFATSVKACFNCLRTGHGSRECTSKFTCNICGNKHHTLLHKPTGGDHGSGSSNCVLNATQSLGESEELSEDSSRRLESEQVPMSSRMKAAAGCHVTTEVSEVNVKVKLTRSQKKKAKNALTADKTVVAEKTREDKMQPTEESPGEVSIKPLSADSTIMLPEVLYQPPLSAVGLGRVDEGRTPMLGTIVVPIQKPGEVSEVNGRALLDNCSQINFVSSDFVKRLGLKVVSSKFAISTVGVSIPQVATGKTSFVIPLPNDEELVVHAYVFTQVTSKMPSYPLDLRRAEEIMRYDLADPNFHIPSTVDMLLGVEVYEELLTNNRVKDGTVALTDTHFGFVVTGSMPVSNKRLSEDTCEDPFTCHAAIARCPRSSVKTVAKPQIKEEHHVAIDDDIRKFWEVNDVKDYTVLAKDPSLYSDEEKFAIKHFEETTTVDADGFFVVKFPIMKESEGPPRELGASRAAAVRMLIAVYAKFAKDPEFEILYREFMQELIDCGHVEEVDERQIFLLPDNEKYYLPHHAVEKESTTTKLRIVMNASAKTSTKFSLNDLLAVGPKLQDDLVCLLIRAGFHRVFITGDVSKMYRMLKLTKEDANLCLFLWKETADSPIRCFRFIRVTYGIASSGTHAIYAMQKAADMHAVSEDARRAIKRDMYVDDFMGGAPSEAEAVKLMTEVIATLGAANLLIRKWGSNIMRIISALEARYKEHIEAFDMQDPNHMIKTLGQAWRCKDDCFFYRVLHVDFTEEELESMTKRQLLGDILKLFDPMGWLSPVTLKLKQFMQQTWSLGIAWEEKLPADIKNNFLEWRKGLVQLRKIEKPRCLLASGDTDIIQVHVFCDASEVGYAACVYTRIQDVRGDVNVSLLFAKAKVAPVKQISVPRLELLAAALGAKILTIVLQSLSSLPITIDQVFAYSDSTTVLAWLSKPSKTWTTFVSNRVSEIQAQVRRPKWYHVKSEDNPADVASRGLNPQDLLDCHLWWKGPTWLGRNFTIPDQTHLLNKTQIEERKTLVCPTTASVVGHAFLTTILERADCNVTVEDVEEKFMDLRLTSSFEKTVRVTVHVFRFLSGFKKYQIKSKVVNDFKQQCEIVLTADIRNCQSVTCAAAIRRKATYRTQTKEQLSADIKKVMLRLKKTPSTAYLKKKSMRHDSIYPSVVECTYVRKVFILREQRMAFAVEFKALTADKPCPKSSALASLYPFIDDDGLIKVGGRLAQSEFLSDSQKYQIVIPRSGPLAALLVRQVHLSLLHGTVQGCLAALRSQYWILGVKGTIKKTIRECVTCFRFMCKSAPQLMADLPRERVTPAQPFEFTGVDFGGPFMVKSADKTGSAKAYLALFVCFASKAVHLELVGSLSAEACIGAFERFANRKGRPKQVFSDNGTNFIGSRNEIERLQKILEKTGTNTLPSAVSSKGGAQWVHIPPRSPHFGGLWESAIKSAKSHLKKIVGIKVLTYEELYTVFVRVEGILNSRPLVELSSDTQSFAALTPGMLVAAKELDHLPLVSAEYLPPYPEIGPDYPKRRWKYVNKIVAHFWSQWVKDYLPTLQVRKKWQREAPNYKSGDLVLLSEDNIPPLKWPLARIVEVYPGNDKLTRVCKVLTEKGTYTRPIVKLRRLPLSD